MKEQLIAFMERHVLVTKRLNHINLIDSDANIANLYILELIIAVGLGDD